MLICSLAVLVSADGPTQPTAYNQQSAAPTQSIIQILSQEDVHPGDGTYRFSFQTENGIEREETGQPKAGGGYGQNGQPSGGYVQQGGWSYTDGYGNPVRLTFSADENGYQPVGDVLPTPVPTEYPVPVVPQAYQGEASYSPASARSGPVPARYSPAPAPARYSPAPAPTAAPARYSPAPAPARYSPAPAPTAAPARYSPAPAPARYSPAPAPTAAPARYSPAPAPARYSPAPSPARYPTPVRQRYN